MNIPNKITVSRILLIPIFMIVILFDFNWGTMNFIGAEMPVNHFVAALIFIIIGYFVTRRYTRARAGECTVPTASLIMHFNEC